MEEQLVREVVSASNLTHISVIPDVALVSIVEATLIM